MNTSVTQAIASLGGSLMDCNQFFSSLTGYAKEQLESVTIFNLIDRQDLQTSFERIASMLEGKANAELNVIPLIVRGSFTQTPGIFLQITSVRRGDGEPLYLCITLLQNHHYPRQQQNLTISVPPADTDEELPAVSTPGL
jgi:hypothetical protein